MPAPTKPIELDGEIYQSIAAAARAIGVAPAFLQKRVLRARASGRPLTIAYLCRDRYSRPIEIDGRAFRSISAAAVALGIDRTKLAKRLNAVLST